jgi:hypothetical protein
LNEEEFHVIQGVLDLGSKTGLKAMTPLDTVFMLSTEDVIDRWAYGAVAAKRAPQHLHLGACTSSMPSWCGLL